MNTAIIVAAGKGTRFNSSRPKQFLEILGKPIIIHTLERFEHCPAIDEIVLVLSADDLNDFAKTADRSDISKLKKIVAGGASRAGSVRNGFNVVDPATGVVAVHDGARPLVSSDEISLTVGKAAETGAACLVAPVTDTIKTVDGGSITGTVDRTKLRRALTPQAFRYGILRQALSDSELDDSVTDECFLVEKLGVRVAFVEGSAQNIKITRPKDLILAEALIEADDRLRILEDVSK